MQAMRFLCTTATAALLAGPAFAQPAPPSEEIIVTAQRQAESLQDVPIAVSALQAAALERQQITSASALQLSLPNITFTKTAFTSSSFTIRGVGDLCVGVTCDQATAIHTNGSPLIGTRLFETEYFDLERIEVLRGPQGTLFGRNATSGVVNFITAKPNLNQLQASAEAEYGNYESVRLKGMLNLPLTDTLGIRVAGFYLKRDGYTKNLFDDSRIDGRDMYALRGSVRWEPTDSTTIDLMGYYFREKDDRLRIQKQLCQRDPTGVLGCLPGRLDFDVPNANATIVGTLASREFLRFRGGTALGPAVSQLGLTSLYGADSNSGALVPSDVRTVNVDFNPTYFAEEQQYQARLEHDFGRARLQLTGLYSRSSVDSRQDGGLVVTNSAVQLPGLTALQNFATQVPAPIGPGLGGLLAPVRSALIPNGPNGPYCTSLPDPNGVGVYGGNGVCGATALNFDRSVGENRTWSAEAILTTALPGPVNVLLGATYLHNRLPENSYYVNVFGLDYAAGILGALNSFGQRQAGNAAYPATFIATPFFRSNTASFRLRSYGLFGELYYDVADGVKLTLGLRYNNDKKDVTARSTLLSFPAPIGAARAFDSPFVGSFDADPGTAGNQLFQVRSANFREFTGRAVLDWKISDDNLVYVSYSRGYKSGGINPPLQPIFAVPETFAPEFIDSIEIGSKNSFLDGTLRLNVTGFHYKYRDLQLSRLVARTSVNDNVDARIFGLEIESIVQPVRDLLVNINVSFLSAEVSGDKFLTNPRDPSGGRADAVIVKDLQFATNCAVVPATAGNAAGANAFVAAVNQSIGASVGAPGLLRAPAPFPAGSGIAATGAYGFCASLESAASDPAPALRALFATPTGALPFRVETSGVPVNVRGNTLPQAPRYKVSVGAQYAFDLGGGLTLTPRADLAFTGESYGNIFNGPVNRIPAYEIVNAQVQIDGADRRWFARAYVQNLADDSAITGLNVGDASTGLATSIFTLEPRRFGVAAGLRF